MGDLSESGFEAARELEGDRLEVGVRRREIRRNILEPKIYDAFNAEAGTVSVRDSRGGVAAIVGQGTLSNAAISAGQPVNPIRVEAVDWSPTLLPPRVIEPRVIEPRDVSARSVGEPGDDDGSGGGDGGDDGDRCTQQLLCYRGVPYEDPVENEPPQPGQCEAVYNFYIQLATTAGIGGPSSGRFGQYQATGRLGPFFTAPGGSGIRLYTNNETGVFNFANGGSVEVNQPRIVDAVRVDGGPDDCGQPPPAYGPPIGSAPEQWRSICSSRPPITVAVDTNSDRTFVTANDASGELARLDFEPRQYQIKIACKENGCDTEPDCSTQRLWVRTIQPPAPGQCPVQYQIRVNAQVEFDPSTFGASNLLRNVNWTSFTFNGPLAPSWYFELPSISMSSNRNAFGWHVGTLRMVSAPNVPAVNFPSRNSAPRIQMPPARSYRVRTLAINSQTVIRVDGQPDTCPEAEPGEAGPWSTAGPLSFNPPIQVSVAVDGSTREHTLSIYDASTTVADPLATVTYPDANYEYVVRCEGDGEPPP